MNNAELKLLGEEVKGGIDALCAGEEGAKPNLLDNLERFRRAAEAPDLYMSKLRSQVRL